MFWIECRLNFESFESLNLCVTISIRRVRKESQHFPCSKLKALVHYVKTRVSHDVCR